MEARKHSAGAFGLLRYYHILFALALAFNVLCKLSPTQQSPRLLTKDSSDSPMHEMYA